MHLHSYLPGTSERKENTSYKTNKRNTTGRHTLPISIYLGGRRVIKENVPKSEIEGHNRYQTEEDVPGNPPHSLRRRFTIFFSRYPWRTF